MVDTKVLVTEAEWKDFFAGFDPIVVVANSEAQLLEKLRTTMPKTALFIFFNRADRLLEAQFQGNSLLVTRSNEAGSELVYRDQVETVATKFVYPGFQGILNLKAAGFETLHDPEDFGGRLAGTLDLTNYLADFYPADHTASSGFAMAVWLYEVVKTSRIVLCGFTGLRSETRKLFLIHDWSFEQTALRLAQASGRLTYAENLVARRYQGLARHFPEATDQALVYAALETLAIRLENTEKMIDRLMSVTAPQRKLAAWLKAIRPKTRKQRLLEKRSSQ